MRRSGIFGFLAVGIATAVVGYFGGYFLAAHYTDVGDQRPVYILSYSIGSHSLYGLRSFFEPARRVDDFLRGRPAVVVSGGS
jgi:hypothetical protein